MVFSFQLTAGERERESELLRFPRCNRTFPTLCRRVGACSYARAVTSSRCPSCGSATNDSSVAPGLKVGGA